MNFESIPIISLKIDSMSHQIKSHLGIEGSELAEAIDKEIKKQFNILLYDVDNKISEEINKAIKSTIEEKIKYYFTYGEGHKIISERLDKILDNIIIKE